MTAALRFPVEPRLLPPVKVARWLHLSLEEFRAALPALRREGFPAPCPVTGHFDRVALDAWQDRRSGLAGKPAPDDADARIRARLEAIG